MIVFLILLHQLIKKINHEIFSFSSHYKNIDKDVVHLIDESGYQDEINKMKDINSISFDGGNESTLSDIDFYLEVIGQPFFFPNLYLSKKSFALASDSGVGLVMNGNDGDTVIVKKADTAENGKIVVALIDDNEAMLKRIRRKGKTVALESANRNYETKIFGPDRVKVQGVLVSLYRNF